MAQPKVRVGVDTGGTFTDLIVMADDGRVVRGKVLSTPDDFSRGIAQALKDAIDENQSFAWSGVAEFVHGTTVATNAVLEGTGARVGLLTTRGFRDVLEIGRCGWDGDIFDPSWQKTPCMVPRELRLEIEERVSAEGEVLQALNIDQVRDEVKRLVGERVDAIAVCFLNAYANPVHERAVRDLVAREHPGLTVCASTDVLAEIREYERASTTVVNAYLVPVMQRYLSQLQSRLKEMGHQGDVLVMQSNGGVMSAASARRKPVHIVESGPAAGVLACAYLAKQTGDRNFIAFDMGGTTAKASLIEDGRWFEAFEYHVGGGMSQGGRHGGGQVLRMPSIDIAEVGAGGGSIAHVDAGGLLKVGPRSAGSAPGPACYGMGGTEPTVTDAYAVLGYLNPQSIAGGSKSISRVLAEQAIRERVASPLSQSVEEAAHAIYTVATANIIRAVRSVTIERGRDARDYALVAFGGAGPLHAAELARAMGVKRVVVPTCSGLFSALGLTMADIEHDYTRTVLLSLDRPDATTLRRIADGYAELESQARAEASEDVGRPPLQLRRSAALHFTGQAHELVLPVSDGPLDAGAMAALAESFCAEHQRVYGYAEAPERVQLVAVRLRATLTTAKPRYEDIGRHVATAAAEAADSREHATREAYFGPTIGWATTPVLRRQDIGFEPMTGPAIVEELDTTIVVPPGVQFALDRFGSIVLTLDETAIGSTSQPLSLELVTNALDAITDEMAGILTRTARSLGIKDAHDFSIALCTAEGELVSGGVGLAIHLGAIPAALAAVRDRFGDDVHDGDVIFMNDPYSGGMHLPDMYVIKPLFVDGELLSWSAVVAHMADIGGRVPGGNAADSTSIYQEGLRIPPLKLYERGTLMQGWLDLVHANVRLGEIVVGDIFAEVAACNTAERQFRALAAKTGAQTLVDRMHGLIAYGERMARAALAACKPGRYSFVDHIDDDGNGGPPVRIEASIDINTDRIRVDLTGTAPQVRGAINAPIAITRSTAAFVVKSMIGADLPNNSGFTRIIDLVAPLGTVANMAFPAACAARALTAYRVMDALYGALAPAMPERVPAAGDGGPAIISVGGDDANGRPFVFMEVLSGAFGARPNGDGLEGVASPFANTQNTSCEMIEANTPLRVEHYGFVPDTGGAGRHRGGLAVRRDIRFLGTSAMLQVRADRQVFAPWGLGGGQPGARSSGKLLRADGREQVLPGKIVIDIAQGDLWSYTSAGAGGFGPPAERSADAIERDLRSGKATSEAVAQIYPGHGAAILTSK